MKTFIVILALVALVLADSEWKVKTPEEMKQIREECLAEHPLSEEVRNKFKNFEYPDEENVRQYLLCGATKIGIFCPDEGYSAERVAEQFHKDMDKSEVKEIAEACINESKEGNPSNDVLVYRTHKCFLASKAGEKVKEFVKKAYEAAEHKDQKSD